MCSSMNIIGWIILGGVAGWLASIIMRKNSQMGAFANIFVGIVGAFIGGFLFHIIGGSRDHRLQFSGAWWSPPSAPSSSCGSSTFSTEAGQGPTESPVTGKPPVSEACFLQKVAASHHEKRGAVLCAPQKRCATALVHALFVVDALALCIRADIGLRQGRSSSGRSAYQL